MRRISFAFFGLALAMACGRVASASTVTVTLTGAGGVVSNDGSVFVGPYQLQVGNQTIKAPCDDYYDEVYQGESWQANEHPLTDYASALFGGQANAQHNYWEAAYLTSLFGKNTSDYNAISYAIWGLFDPGATESSNYAYSGDDGHDAGYFVELAAQNGSLENWNFNYFKGWQILTPVDGSQSEGGQPQEFMATPEPATLVMLGSGLLAVGLALRKRAASQAV